ncbi:hypothetical protein DB35_25500 [Streptomyces abyssalis]|uniref:Membrane protein SCJ1.26 n=1 Tax=Streptomyces abyssalis TaxID=933944 RepID=A0A1E7JN11_9ACTN|nr:hypothetical protein [Streptomyces abyssalis]OEU86943.1 hypothetical protein DB35_25500 [Streptomyces abyssalis]OEU89672.1 hypothetical protein AN215_08065 [Streptomyces abyssalis]OEV07325.1 hypothetical protein AN219_32370 [Streptomyces nanshensis]
MRTRRWLWRWRNNPLKRRSDRAEAWAGLAAGLIMAVTAPLTGALASDAVAGNLRDQPGLHRTSAVLREDAPTTDGVSTVSDDPTVLTEVSWETADGRSRSGRAPVETGTPEGTRVQLWLDGRGMPHQPPPDATEVSVESGAAGGAVAVGTCFLVGSGAWVVRRRLDAGRDKDWEREWATVGPRWSKRD